MVTDIGLHVQELMKTVEKGDSLKEKLSVQYKYKTFVEMEFLEVISTFYYSNFFYSIVFL